MRDGRALHAELLRGEVKLRPGTHHSLGSFSPCEQVWCHSVPRIGVRSRTRAHGFCSRILFGGSCVWDGGQLLLPSHILMAHVGAVQSRGSCGKVWDPRG